MLENRALPEWRVRAGWGKRAIADLADAVLPRLFRLLPVGPRLERLAIAWAFRYRGQPRVVRLRGGGEVRVDPTDYLQALVYYLGVFEPHCQRVLARLLRPGQVAVDVGANIGVFTVLLARAVGPAGRVIAVEAVPPNVEALTANVRRNDLKQVTVVPTAVGAHPGELRLTRPRTGNRGAFTAGEVDGAETYAVPVRRLDDVLAENAVSQVDVVKMDIEGSEYAALGGAERLLGEQRPTLLLEVNAPALANCGASSADLLGLLESAGYRGWRVRPQGIEPLASIALGPCEECLFVHETRPAHLHALRLGPAGT